MTRNARQVEGSSDRGHAAPTHRRARRPLGVRVAFGVVLFIVAIALVSAGLFAGHRWLPDDEADMRGTWYLADTVVPVVFEDGFITLSADVSYEYSIDPKDKTIRYKLGNLEGEGRYWFSADRSRFYVEDGQFGFYDTLSADLAWVVGELRGMVSGAGEPSLEGRECAAFSRTPGSRTQAELQARVDALSLSDREARE